MATCRKASTSKSASSSRLTTVEDVAIELRCHSGGVVVSPDEPADVLDQVGAQQQAVTRLQRRRPAPRETPTARRRAGCRSSSPGTRTAAGPRSGFSPDASRNRHRQRRFRCRDTPRWMAARGLGQYAGVDVERHEPAQRTGLVQRVQQDPGLLRCSATQFDQCVGAGDAPRSPRSGRAGSPPRRGSGSTRAAG